MIKTQISQNPMVRVLSLRNVRLLFTGAGTSMLGDQFALVATPWLTLKLTGDPLALGIVLALEGFPRAVFMLLGGAVTDRFSPRLIMFLSDIIRFLLTTLMAVVVFTGTVQMWMLYAFGLGFGLVAGFAVPAANSILPRLVEEQDLQAGNSIGMGMAQFIGFVGPTIAGILIGKYSTSYMGIGWAFALDAISFAVSALTLWLIRAGGRIHLSSTEITRNESVWTSILDGLKFLWNDQALRLMFLVILAVNFLLIGPLLVGIPVLADRWLPEGAVAFGLLMSGYAGGNLGGYLLAGSLPRPSGLALKLVILALMAAFGTVIGLLGFIRSTWVDFALMVLLGLGNGYVAIILFTWMQTHTPKEMMGRMMSILMLSSTGLVPVSQAISGAVIKWSFNILFVTAGALSMLATLWAAFQPGLKALSENIAVGQAGESAGSVDSVSSN